MNFRSNLPEYRNFLPPLQRIPLQKSEGTARNLHAAGSIGVIIKKIPIF